MRDRSVAERRAMAGLNKRILCFVDECGTAGEEGFALGCVMAWARECGRADKAFSELLEPNANELHAAKVRGEYLQSLLVRFAQTDRPQGMILLNRIGTITQGSPSAIYAGNVIETVKVAIGEFRKLHNFGNRGVGNVELILDRNHHNCDPECQRIINQATESDGRFKAVNAVAQINSAASRLLQLADAVAYVRRWIQNGEENANGLHEKFGIRVQ